MKIKDKIKEMKTETNKILIKFTDLQFDEDFKSERANFNGFFQIALSLPKGYQITGYTRENKIKIRWTGTKINK